MPQIHCFIDGVAIDGNYLPPNSYPNEFSDGTINNVCACWNLNSTSSVAVEHELLVNITNFYGSAGWFLDYITFESHINPIPNGEILQAGKTVPFNFSTAGYSTLVFEGMLENKPDSMNVTHSNVTIRFNGMTEI